MWLYKISTGQMFNPDGVQVAKCYSGYGEYANDPTKTSIPHLGPIPEGDYTIGKVEAKHGSLGPIVMALIPDTTNNMFGRSAFFMHGVSVDNPATPEDESKLSSHGCICAGRTTRKVVAASKDRKLRVIA